MTSVASPAGGKGHERPGGDHVQSRPEQQPRCPRESPRSSWHSHQARDEGSRPIKIDCRSGDPIGKLGPGKPRGRTRPIRKRPPHHWRIAIASAKEVDSHLRLLAAAGAVDRIGAENALETFDHVRAMTWRLLNPI